MNERTAELGPANPQICEQNKRSCFISQLSFNSGDVRKVCTDPSPSPLYGEDLLGGLRPGSACQTTLPQRGSVSLPGFSTSALRPEVTWPRAPASLPVERLRRGSLGRRRIAEGPPSRRARSDAVLPDSLQAEVGALHASRLLLARRGRRWEGREGRASAAAPGPLTCAPARGLGAGRAGGPGRTQAPPPRPGGSGAVPAAARADDVTPVLSREWPRHVTRGCALPASASLEKAARRVWVTGGGELGAEGGSGARAWVQPQPGDRLRRCSPGPRGAAD